MAVTEARSREGRLAEQRPLVTLGLIMGVVGFTAVLFGAVLYAIDPGVARLAAGNVGFGVVCLVFYAVTNRSVLTRAVAGRSSPLVALEVLTVVGVLAAVFALNWVAVNNDEEWDLTRDGVYSLHPQSVEVAERLERAVKLYAFFRPNESTIGILGQAVELYRLHTPHLELVPVNPDTASETFLKKFGLDNPKSARIVFEDSKTGRFTKIKVPTEEAMTNALIQVSEDRERKAYFLTGHGEPSIKDGKSREGYATAALLLGNEGLHAEELSLVGRSDVPDDASVLILRPQTALLPNEAEAVKVYLDRGGRALVLLEPSVAHGLDRIFRPYGIAVGDDLVVDDNPASRALGFGADAPVVQTYEAHPITNVMNNAFTMFFRARSVSPRAGIAQVSVTTLVQTSPRSWAESTPGEEPVQDEADLAGPVPIAVAATKRTTSHPRLLNPEARLVVVGDHHFIDNRFSAMTGNANLFVNAVNWLAGDEDRITIRPPQKAGDRLHVTAAQQNGIMFFSVNLLPLLIIGMGFSVWAVRRRR